MQITIDIRVDTEKIHENTKFCLCLHDCDFVVRGVIWCATPLSVIGPLDNRGSLAKIPASSEALTPAGCALGEIAGRRTFNRRSSRS